MVFFPLIQRRLFHALPSASKFIFSPQVKQAIQSGGPVVALESTIISHGMPYPQNVETARVVESIVRDQGAIPATIAILNGHVHIGLDKDALEELGKIGPKAVKASRRDLAPVIALKQSGATTVASTMMLARAAGIPVFVTGGIGGVHRGADQSFDISADLTELGRTPVAVVCAGVKSILDIEKTLEVLETQGVTVATVGSSKRFPAFYTPDSGFDSPSHVPDAKTAAQVILANHDLDLKNGMVFAVPIPEEHAANSQIIQDAIDTAVQDARSHGIRGKEETPYLLKRVTELTVGKSLESNIALIKNNAVVGGQIAVALSKLKMNRR
ncbi:pseudouridine-5'-phosphate glycosidase [Halteromyces radiatus]|uniref:pseudouridine-5'-phosphate glycosidase n=1 Tax=Halteromyces radiatus TaxID=101107 RepID=UPI0022204AE0|nr:pseudouridine-5'-phosphate glycosidase [Halteromyces radiatus]KAI8084485.1 pseudouridine-5'-phosphate glycosidase [Halteromyces radiatus]